MHTVNRCRKIITLFVAPVFLCALADAQVVRHSSGVESPDVLRQILATQPNYIAIKQFIFSEASGGGFGATSKAAKIGARLRDETEDTIFINESGKPTIKIYPKRREYTEQQIEPDELNDALEFSPEKLARQNNVTFKLLGREKVGKYNCLKIEVAYKDKKLKGMKFVFYAAPELKNLVIREESYLGEQARFITQLSDISFNVSERLFLVPADYKKIVEPSYREQMDSVLRKIKPMPNKPAQPTP